MRGRRRSPQTQLAGHIPRELCPKRRAQLARPPRPLPFTPPRPPLTCCSCSGVNGLGDGCVVWSLAFLLACLDMRCSFSLCPTNNRVCWSRSNKRRRCGGRCPSCSFRLRVAGVTFFVSLRLCDARDHRQIV